MDQDRVTVDADVAAWLAQIIGGMTVEVGHPDARATATMAWRALDQLTEKEQHDPDYPD